MAEHCRHDASLQEIESSVLMGGGGGEVETQGKGNIQGEGEGIFPAHE